MNSYCTESYILSRTMDKIGYGKSMIAFRQKAFRTAESACNRSFQELQLENVWAGSKAEGLRAFHENDTDVMYVPTDVLCTEYPAAPHNREVNHLFHLRMQDTPAGYTFLQPYKTSCNNPSSTLIDCLVELAPGHVYLSSDSWRNVSRQLIHDYLALGDFVQVDQEEHGPSVTTLAHNFYSFDGVSALACECPTYMNAWVHRKRSYLWPSAEVMKDVNNLNAHVVPVGYIDSGSKFLEWRICFTQGEIRLMKSLNDCLTKVVILLKEIAKVCLKPICKEMSTYVMKNVVMWVAELNNSENFTERKLIPTLMFALQFLKWCITANKLPSYMIPERNLLADRVSVSQRNKLYMKIASLLKEGPSIILNCRKIKNALTVLYRSPEEFRVDCDRRQRIEILTLLLLTYSGRFLDVHPDYIQNIISFANDDAAMQIVRSIIGTIPETNGKEMEWLHADMGLPNDENVKKTIDFLNKAGQMQFKNIPYLSYLHWEL